MDLAEYRNYNKKPNKYNAKRTIVDGITFDSKKEADYYCKLKLLQKAGEVVKFEMQVPFTLFDGFKINGKSVMRPVKYILDFRVKYKNGDVKYFDTKGFMTPLAQLKLKWMMDKFGIFVEVV